MYNSISVGLGEEKISRLPTDVLVAYGLGSCLGIGMFDPISRVAGLLHAVLPDPLNGSDPNNAKYVSYGIPILIENLVKNGADPRRLVIRMAGGANMLLSPGLSQTFDIGTRNIASALATFSRLRLKLVSQDVGGNIGRTVRLYPANGRITVRMIGGIEKDI
ncbi:MAG: chemotaxis protein CheD [Chloroflexota bacterium]|nr:MAG: chemotaxis protein CheD [Chloroflexota bacterium]